MINIRQHMGKLILVVVLSAMMWILYQGLYVNQRPKQTSAFTPFPAFSLQEIHNENSIITKNDLANQVSFIHVFASWCSVCMNEHKDLIEIRKRWPYALVGVVYRDNPQFVRRVLSLQGDPFTLVLNDASGSLGLELGIRGVPESFVVDKKGNIRYHSQGKLSLATFEKEILPIMKEVSTQ